MAANSDGSVHELTLPVNDVNQIFDAADLNPLRNPTMAGSSMDLLHEQVAELEGKPFKVTIILPPDKITPGLEDQIRTAIQTYCEYKIESNEYIVKDMKRVGRHQAWVNLPWMIIIIIAAGSVAFAIKSGNLGNIADFVLIIAWHILFVLSWVVIYMALDYWFYEWRPIAHQNEAWKKIQQAPISVVATPSSEGSSQTV